jgi:hypothetical protein
MHILKLMLLPNLVQFGYILVVSYTVTLNHLEINVGKLNDIV